MLLRLAHYTLAGGLALECGKWKNESFWSRIDCVNAEVVVDPANLAITKLVLEVDTRFGDCALITLSLTRPLTDRLTDRLTQSLIHLPNPNFPPTRLIHSLSPRTT